MKDWFLTLKRRRTIQWFLFLLSLFSLHLQHLSPFVSVGLSPSVSAQFDIFREDFWNHYACRCWGCCDSGHVYDFHTPTPLPHAVSVHFNRAHICMRVCINMEMELPLFYIFPSFHLPYVYMCFSFGCMCIWFWSERLNVISLKSPFTSQRFSTSVSSVFFKGGTGSYIKEERKKNQKSLPFSL